MDWDQTRTVYLEKMEKASALLDRTLALCLKTPAEVSTEKQKNIEKLRELVQRQEKKLKDNRFEVAVLGLEKAGKSTLLNAWLGIEILPEMDLRCTYTSCEIWSAPSENEQSYIIEYYSPEEFQNQLEEKQRLIQELPNGFSERNDLEKDIQEIELHQNKIQSFLKQGRNERKFDDVSEVREDLKQAIATNIAQARAIRRIVLKTVKLRTDRDIVFHDVPGFNSPLKLHKSLAEDKLKCCDAILYAKEHSSPSLVDSEINMLKIADAEDPHVRVAGKIFIALTKIDNSKSKQQISSRIRDSHSMWNDIPVNRIVPVCPPAHLFKLGISNSKLKEIGPKILSDLKEIGYDDGIEELKDIVNNYIDTDRAQVLGRRCKGLINDTENQVSKITESLLKQYPDNTEELELTQEDEAFNAFIAWWTKEWNDVEEKFIDYYLKTIMPKEHVDAPAQEHEKLREFQGAYNNLIDQFVKKLDYSDENFEQHYRILGTSQEGIVHPQTAHIKLREKLHSKALDDLNKLSSELAETLEKIIGEIGNWVYDRMWEIQKIKNEVIESPNDLHDRLEHGMATLFLRFARPAVNLFLNHPRGSRDKYLETYHAEMVTLKEFYKGEDKEIKQHLETFLKIGKWVLEVTESSHPLTSALKKTTDYLDIINSQIITRKEPATLDEIQVEIREDLEALKDYLKNSIFYAAGFISYCRQELDRIKGRFLNNEKTWMTIVRSALRRKHPLLIAEKTLDIKDYEFRRDIIAELSEVRKMLTNLKK